MTSHPQVTLRKDWVEVESCAGYRSIRLAPTLNDVGDWQITLPADHPAARLLLEGYAAGDDLSRWGIVARWPGSSTVLLSGSAVYGNGIETAPATTGILTLKGLCDNALLNGEIAFPSTTTDVSTTALTTFSASHDVRNLPAETALLGYISANIGPAAGIARRQYAFLDIPTSQGRGAVRRYSARMDYLIDLAARIGQLGGIAFRLVQGVAGRVTVEVWVPQLVQEAAFSVRAGTASRAELTWQARETTEVVAGGRGDLTARVFHRRTASGTHAFRRVKFSDQNNAGDPADTAATITALQEAGDDELVSGQATAGVQLTPVSIPGRGFGELYNLGDRVPVVVAGVEFIDVVTRVVIEMQGGGPLRETPTVGAVDPQDLPELEPRVRQLARDLGTVTRR